MQGLDLKFGSVSFFTKADSNYEVIYIYSIIYVIFFSYVSLDVLMNGIRLPALKMDLIDLGNSVASRRIQRFHSLLKYLS